MPYISPGQAIRGSDTDSSLDDVQIAAFAHAAGFSGNNLPIAVAIAKAESGGKADAKGGPNSNGSYDWGLFQINDVHKPTETQKFNPLENAKVAFGLMKRRGNFKDWATYNSGSYRKHLSDGNKAVKELQKRGPEYEREQVANAASIASKGTDNGGGILDGLTGLPRAITGVANKVAETTTAVTSTAMKIGVNLAAIQVALVLLILGIVILFRGSIKTVTGSATKVAKVVK